jgi:dipeptidyl aminopeptidase/acylaminoacyl peptidase
MTPTSQVSTTTAPTSTETAQPFCTPPACAENESYYCPDQCIGGCGTICATHTATATPVLHPLSIAYLRQQQYPASPVIIEEVLEHGDNYERYYASYQSEGLKIYGLLTVPWGQKPESGWPVIIFNHGYIPPDQYRTTERYSAYVDGFARSGYIVFRPDYRGHDRSEGIARSTYRYPDYVVDVLNATAALKNFEYADPNRIGMWGHSMGGYIALRAMVTDPDIKVGVIWAGVVAPYETLVFDWFRSSRNNMLETYGTPEDNPEFWNSISANYFLDNLSGPLQLHHSTSDTTVPYKFSITLSEQVRAVGQTAELFLYDGDDHNISENFSSAMLRSIRFFDENLKEIDTSP